MDVEEDVRQRERNMRRKFQSHLRYKRRHEETVKGREKKIVRKIVKIVKVKYSEIVKNDEK